MCLFPDEYYLSKFLDLKVISQQKTFYAYKIIQMNGRARICEYLYHPGINVALQDNLFCKDLWNGIYDPNRPRGIHVYMNLPYAIEKFLSDSKDYMRLLRIICNIDDLVAIECSILFQQAVLKKVTITPEDWNLSKSTFSLSYKDLERLYAEI